MCVSDTDRDRQTAFADHLLADLRAAGDDGSDIEAKRAKSGFPQSLWETVSAFANTTGGFILLGVEQRRGFQVTGVDDPPAMANRLASLCTDEMEPPVRAEISSTPLEGQRVVVAHIPPTPHAQRPCHLKRLGPFNGSRLRVNDGDRSLTEYEVSLWLNERQQPAHDRRLVTDASLEDLDSTTLARFVTRLRSTRRSVLGAMSDDEILRRTQVAGVDGDGTLRPTLAGALAFGIYPQQFYPQLNVTVVVFPTDRPGEVGPRGERFVDNRSVDGNVAAMLAGTLEVLHPHLKRRGIVQGLYRVEEPEYPSEVLREAVVNALVHRDYSPSSLGAQVQIELYPSRLLIRNPGGLYGPVDVTQLGFVTVTSARNPLLLKLMEDTEAEPGRAVCENRGSGLATIREILGRLGMNPPTFRDNVSTFEFEVSNESLIDEPTAEWLSELGVAGLRPTQLSALAYLKRRNHRLTNSTFRTISGLRDSRDAGRQLRELVERGLLVQIGQRGSASYTLAEPTTATGVAARVLAALGDDTLSAREIAERLGMSRQQTATVLSRLRRDGVVDLVGVPRSKNARWRRT
jgi:ATP-dependent DNA helicase RecG